MSGYITLTRQSGLFSEMQTVANNLANMSTAGYRKEGVIFSEMIRAVEGPAGSVSMGAARVRDTKLSQGPVSETGGTFDFAIEGDGFFLIETPNGQRLTRAGTFTPDAAGELVTPDGYRLLDAGGAPIFVPPDAKVIALADDGTISADGVPLTQVGLYAPNDLTSLIRETGVMFDARDGFQPVEGAKILQGFVEGANVDPVLEITRMIEVQRSYELGQSFRDKESERHKTLIETLGKQ